MCVCAPVKEGLNKENFLGLDLDISSLTLRTSKRLVDHNARVGQRFPLARSSGTEEECTHGCRSAEANSGDIAGNVLHGIIDGHTRRHRPTRRVDCRKTNKRMSRATRGEMFQIPHPHRSSQTSALRQKIPRPQIAASSLLLLVASHKQLRHSV
jgi:hypothetical protein